jgi:hypothetical protein
MIEDLINSTIKNIPDPYFSDPNLSLTFKVGNGIFLEDESGNQVEQTFSYVVLASVTTDASNKEYEMPGQIGLDSLVLCGRCVNPKLLPPGLVNKEKFAIATLTDLASGQVQTGVFTFIPVVQQRFEAFTNHMGTAIKGYFSTTARV